ncbi:glycosyl hydrolase family 28-related protein [Paraburkholderia atlantica]|uniref:glycosyl hydrolase family 28-related protein n=1 Tax=Paraburkholderia atlantica TaxID=2654982 RepID=UPI003D19044A
MAEAECPSGCNPVAAIKRTLESTFMRFTYWACSLLLSGLVAALSLRLADRGDAAAGEPPASDLLGMPPVARTIFAPPLVDPVNPVDFGAKCDGVSDDSSAFQAALDVGDVRVPAGTCVIDHTVKITVSHRHMECTKGTTLRQTKPVFSMFSVVAPDGETLTGDSIANCVFEGTNSAAPRFILDDDALHYNIPVETRDRVSDFTLVGNTFRRFFGQAMFQTYGEVDGGSGDVIAYNRFESCGYYGAVFVAHRHGYIGHNVLIDCAVGVENDNAQQLGGDNVIEYNDVRAIHGYGAPDMGASVLLTGGTAGDADYSTNIVRYNTVMGVSKKAYFSFTTRPSIIWQKAGGGAAQYRQNTCVRGCKVVQ